ITSEGAFAAQIEINIEIAHRQLTKGAINRLAITAAGEIRFCHRAPMPAHFENRHDVISVLFRFQIKDQRLESKDAQRRRAENSALETRGSLILQNFFGRSRGETQIVRQIVEKFLDTCRSLQSA